MFIFANKSGRIPLSLFQPAGRLCASCSVVHHFTHTTLVCDRQRYDHGKVSTPHTLAMHITHSVSQYELLTNSTSASCCRVLLLLLCTDAVDRALLRVGAAVSAPARRPPTLPLSCHHRRRTEAPARGRLVRRTAHSVARVTGR